MTLKSHIFYTFHWKIHESFYEELYYYYISNPLKLNNINNKLSNWIDCKTTIIP